MDGERLRTSLPIVDEWRSLIMANVPQQLAISMGGLVNAMHESWLAVPEPPTTPAATAVCAMVAMGELVVTDNGNLRRSRESEQPQSTERQSAWHRLLAALTSG